MRLPPIPRRGVLAAFLAVTLTLVGACSDPAQTTPTDVSANDSGGAIFDGGATGDGVTTSDVSVGDSGGGGAGVWLTFEVDDSANQTFADGDIKWTGSFTWDSKTNTIIPATSWLPTDGPYPLLYDDGPLSKGGHEKEGATAGDHRFSTAVKFVAVEDTTLEYGALNEFDNWMWIGTNGQLEVKKGATGTLDAKGLVLPKHGKIDLKLELDTAKLNAKFTTWTTKSHKFYSKGTMNMWTPVQLLDDGKKGDEKATDGKLTYVQSQYLGKHDGLLNAASEVQFIFVTTTGDAFPDEGQEYKGATEAYKDGVRAWTNTGAGGAWVEVTVELKVDSKGKFKNTAVMVPATTVTPCDPACKTGETCTDGTCVKDVPKVCDPACKADETCTDGKCMPSTTKVCDPLCKTGETCTDGKCVKDTPKVCTPACKDTETCVDGTCAPKTCKPDCAGDQKCVVDTCIDLPAISQVDPAKGPLAGGTKATLTGKGFAAPAKVWFGGVLATDVQVKDATSLTCITPAGTTGAVKVEVEVGGEKASKDKAFTYDAAPKPTALLIAPLVIAVEEGGEIKGLKAIVKVPTVSQSPGATPGLSVDFGFGAAGTDPSAKDAKWVWKKATFASEDTTKGEETWTADFGKLDLGSYAFTVRASYATYIVYGDSTGSEDGVDVKKLGSLTVNKPDATPTATGFETPYMAATNGKLVILGKNLTSAAKVTFKSDSGFPPVQGTNVAVVTGKGISVDMVSPNGTIPAFPGTVTVTPEKAAPIVMPTKLDVAPIGTPTIDGDPTEKEWKITQAAALQASDWGGANTLSALFVHYDKDNFYLGFTGTVEKTNAIVVYFDTDYGAATGVKSPTDLKDSTGALDDAISNLLKMLDGKFGAEFAMGTVGMASQTTGKAADSTNAGWRSLATPADLFWLGGKVVAKDGVGVEASLPLKEMFPKGIPAGGATVAFFVKLVNADGSKAPKNGAIPDQKTSDPATIDTVLTVRVYQLP